MGGISDVHRLPRFRLYGSLNTSKHRLSQRLGGGRHAVSTESLLADVARL